MVERPGRSFDGVLAKLRSTTLEVLHRCGYVQEYSFYMLGYHSPGTSITWAGDFGIYQLSVVYKCVLFMFEPLSFHKSFKIGPEI